MINRQLSHLFQRSLPIFTLIATLIINGAPQQHIQAASQSLSRPSTAITKSAHDAYGKLPTSFIANAGQLDPSVRFEVRSNAGHLFFTPQGVTLALTAKSNSPKPMDDRSVTLRHTPPIDTTPQTNVAVRVNFDGSNPNAILGGADQQPGIANFFIGNDPAQWHSNVPTFAGVTYHDLYPGIDLTYNGHGGVLKGTYTVAPGIDPSLIRWHYDGATDTRLDPTSGDLLIEAANGLMLTEQVPEVWQTDTNGLQHPVAAHYTLVTDGTVQFTLGAYDPALALVIDPGLVYSTYLGGIGDDFAYGIAVDSSGNAYVTGQTANVSFPRTNGAFQTVGSYDSFVVKLTATGTRLVYSTYLSGGMAYGITVDGSGSAYVTGFTSSTDFPTTVGAIQTVSGGYNDGFVIKLNAAGSQLVYSTYLGGGGYDEARGIAVDSSGNSYIVGFTNGPDFPTTKGAYQTVLGGNYDAFIVKLNDTGSRLTYSTYLGGIGGMDYGEKIALDNGDNTYVMGVTYGISGNNFPTTSGAFQTLSRDPIDVFVAKLNATGTRLVYSTYLGGSQCDKGGGIAVDSSGNAYVTGGTQSYDFPTTSGAFQTTYKGGSMFFDDDVFVVKLNPAGTGLIYSTLIGDIGHEDGGGIVVDNNGNVYVTGGTQSAYFPTTAGAFQTIYGSGYESFDDDAFVIKLNTTGTRLIYSTFVGGSGIENGSGIALDNSGNVYVTGFTSSPNFPTTKGAYQTGLRGGYDSFITKLDLTPNIHDAIDIFRPSPTFYLHNSNPTGSADITTTSGIFAAIPMTANRIATTPVWATGTPMVVPGSGCTRTPVS
ncbi:MAG: SBBP repeat-containing protein [Chloroflexota bacterium]